MPTRRRSASSVRYEVDAFNRLTLTDPRDVLHPTRTFDGTWALTPEHELAFALRAAGGQRRQTLYLKGAIAEVRANALIVALDREQEGERTSQRLSLSGRWRADERNRLTFLVAKADGTEDRLILQGGWEVGKRHELRYRYTERALRRGVRAERVLTFAGAWEIPQADRLVYRLSGSSTSAFEFQAALQSRSLRAADGRVAYEVGLGLSRGTLHRQRVTLFGSWKVNRDLSVSFEIPSAGGRVQAIRFEGAYRLTARDRVAVALQNSRHEPLGLTLTFTRDMARDTNLFLRLRREGAEQSVVGGVQVRF